MLNYPSTQACLEYHYLGNPMSSTIKNEHIAALVQSIDKELSNRFIKLDPSGYFLIRLEPPSAELVVEHYSNDLDDKGIAIDPETGEPLSCNQARKRIPTKVFKGRSAKEVGIKLSESEEPCLISRLDHAMYLGRELQRAESCLINGEIYIQD